MRRSVKTGDILINLVTTTQSRLDESEFVNMILSQKIDGKCCWNLAYIKRTILADVDTERLKQKSLTDKIIFMNTFIICVSKSLHSPSSKQTL